MNSLIAPLAIQPGATFGLISPSAQLVASYPHRLKRAQDYLESYGYSVISYPPFLSGSRAQFLDWRLSQLHDAFEDSSIDAIVCTIGGLSSNDLLPELDYSLISTNPKVFCGYSDITLLHSAIARMSRLKTFYGPMAMTQLAEYPTTLSYTHASFERVLSSTQAIGEVLPSTNWTDEYLDWRTKNDLTKPRSKQANLGYVTLVPGQALGSLFIGCLPSLRKPWKTRLDHGTIVL